MDVYFKINTLYARKLSFCIDYVLNVTIDNVFLLEEYHNNEELWLKHLDKNVFICNDFDAKEVRKNICFDETFINANDLNSKIKTNELNYTSKPLILIASIGNYDDTYCLEILLNKIMNMNGWKAKQKFSKEAETIIRKLEKMNLLNGKLKVNALEYDLIIEQMSANIFDSYIDFFYAMHKLSPSIIFLCADSDFDKYDMLEYIKNLVCSNCYLYISPFINYEINEKENMPVYKVNEDIKSLYNKNVQEEINKIILDLLYLPNDIKIVK